MRNANYANVVWRDRKRRFGLPVCSVLYEISADRLFRTVGFLSQHQSEIQLYQIQDLAVTRTFAQIVCGVGTVVVTTFDNKTIHLENIRSPWAVKELLYGYIEEEKRKKWYRRTNYLGRPPDLYT